MKTKFFTIHGRATPTPGVDVILLASSWGKGPTDAIDRYLTDLQPRQVPDVSGRASHVFTREELTAEEVVTT